MKSNINFIKLNEQSEITDFLETEIKNGSSESIAANGVFRIGLSGGSIAKYLSEVLCRIDPNNLEKFRIFFCDERFVPETDKDSIRGVYKSALIPTTCLKKEHFVNINTNLTLKECAQDYEEKIMKEFHLKAGEIPQFDMLFLGIGPDGHTCSLFPQHAVLKEKNRLVATVNNSPKPPPQRVTMTFPLINKAKRVIFVALGEDKADIIKRIFIDMEDLPAGMVTPENKCYCVLDSGSGRYINC